MADPRRAAGRAARRLARPVRDRVARPALARMDHRRDVRAVEASGVFDQEWVEAQLGRTFATRAEAIAAYVGDPAAALSPHPLFLNDWLYPDRIWRREGSPDPLSWHLRHPGIRASRSPHPLFDVVAHLEQHPEADQHPGAALGHWLATAGDDTLLPVPVGDPPVAWGPLRAALLEALLEARADERTARALQPVSALPAPGGPDASDGSDESDAPPATGPLVSVVTIAHDQAPLLARTVATLQRQRYRSWELLVVDEASTDDTPSVLEGLAHFEDRVRVLRRPVVGRSAAGNAALAAASGEYVAFLDPGATWTPDLLARLVAALQDDPARELAHAAVEVTGADRGAAFRAFAGGHQALRWDDGLDLGVLVARRDLVHRVGGFDESLAGAEDYDLVLRLTREAAPHLVPFVGRRQPSSDAGAGPVADGPWQDVVRLRELTGTGAGTPAAPVVGRLSVVLPVRFDQVGTVRWLRRLLAPTSGGSDGPDIAEDRDVELVVVCAGAPRGHRLAVASLAAAYDGVRVVTTPTPVSLAVALSLGARAATGETIVLASTQTVPDRAGLGRLADALGPDVALSQAVTLAPDGTVVSAGGVLVEDDPVPQPFLAGHLPDDLDGLPVRPGTTVELPTVLGDVVAVRTETLRALGGLDPLAGAGGALADLGLRAREAGWGTTVLVPDVRLDTRTQPTTSFAADAHATAGFFRERKGRTDLPSSVDLWQRAGFALVGHRTQHLLPAGQEPDAPGPLDRPVSVLLPELAPAPGPVAVDEQPPRLRWALDIAAPSTPQGRTWGDLHFARSLQAALRRQGQAVGVDFRDSRHRPSRDLDDVVLTLRGLDRTAPRLGALNLMWVISHPDLVDGAEAAGFDAVYAASTDWATRRTAEWGVPVRPLLQCTDPALFAPDRGEPDTGPAVLFLGNSRGHHRPSLEHALASGADVTVIGGGWDPIIGAGRVSAVSVPNEEVGPLYASAGVVLNDHWEDMRREGFVSNRLFDAVACGARVLTDEVPGLPDVLAEAVTVFTDRASLRAALADPDRRFPDLATRRASAARVRAEHSFDDRARELVEQAVRLRASRRG